MAPLPPIGRFGPRRWRAATIGTTAALTAAVSFAQPAWTSPSTAPASRPGDVDLPGLIRQLGADEGSDRAAAQRRLVRLGSGAEPSLQAAADHDADLEVRSRARAALLQISDFRANGPTLLTVHATNADANPVLAEIGRQAHVDWVGAFGGTVARPGQRLTIDADDRPFWDVLADVCGQLNVCPPIAAPPNHAALQLYPTGRNWLAPGGPHQVVGPFWVGVSGLYRQRSVEWPGPPLTDDQFLARLVVYPEPKLDVTQVSPLVLREATDDLGNSLLPQAPAGRLPFRPAARLPARTVEARLRYPTGPAGRRIVTLAGDLTVTLAQDPQRFEATDVLTRPTVTRPLPGVTVRVAVVRQVGDTFAVTVECVRDGMPDAQWAALTGRVSDLSVEDAAGRPLTGGRWGVDAGNTDGLFKATGQFSQSTPANRLGIGMAAAPPAPPAGEPARIAWAVAARFKVVTLPVAFHDLPMP